MLQNAYFVAKIGTDTAENEQKFAENLPKIDNYPTGPGFGRRPGSAAGQAEAHPREAGAELSLVELRVRKTKIAWPKTAQQKMLEETSQKACLP